jgi:hypothetical protein
LLAETRYPSPGIMCYSNQTLLRMAATDEVETLILHAA